MNLSKYDLRTLIARNKELEKEVEFLNEKRHPNLGGTFDDSMTIFELEDRIEALEKENEALRIKLENNDEEIQKVYQENMKDFIKSRTSKRK